MTLALASRRATDALSEERPEPVRDFASDLLAALGATPRSIAPKYFYDREGSQLFDQICGLPEYYPTRTELQILKERAGEIATHIGPNAELVEFGAGSTRCASQTPAQCPRTTIAIATYHVMRASTSPLRVCSCAVPNRFQRQPNGSEIRDSVFCPCSTKLEKLWAAL